MKAQTERTDRRTQKTKKALSESLIQLILEKHYDSITVQDIIDRANVGRSTFYLHFRDKEDLLMSDWKGFLDFFISHFCWENLMKRRFVPMRELCFHLKEYHAFYRALVRSQKSERLFNEGCRMLAENIENELVRRFNPNKLKIPSSILADFLAREIFGHLRWWLDRNMPNSPEEMDGIFHNLVMSGFRQAFTDNE